MTLLELLVALALLGLLITGISSLGTYAHFHMITSDLRAQLQNDLSLVLEDMSKSILRATGDINNPGITDLSNGFRVRVDTDDTPDDYGDDSLIDYYLAANRIQKEVDAGGPENLTRPIITTFNYNILDNGTGVWISLTSRHDVSQSASLNNPELRMLNRVYSRSASRN